MKKRLLSVLLTLCMVFTLMPISAFAEDGAVEIAAPACTCATACTAESMNTACAVCGADGATPEQCANYVAPEQPTDTPAPAATLTVLLPVGLKVDGMEKVDDSTNKVTRTVDENGISPIAITSEEEGAFSEKLEAALNNNDAFKNNKLTAAYDKDAKTLTVTGKPTATADFSLNMGEILAAVTQMSANEIMLAEDTTPENGATEDTATEDGTTGDTPKDPVTLTLLLPEGLSADGMESVDEFTYRVTRTVDENGSIAPIVISCEDAGSFSTELAEEINKASSISENGLSAAYDSENDTLIISGSPATSVELNFEEILTAAMDAMGEYETLVAAQTISTDIILANGKELTIVEQITISGNVTISGNGTITRTDANGYISVPSGATLTLDGVTVDGNNLAGTYGMILVEGGTLIIKDSTVQNCVASATRGGAISVESNGNLTIDNTTIQNCQNRSEGGGAIYIESSTVTINSGTFKNNKAVYEYNGQSYWRDGGFIYNYKGTLTINGGTFENNSAGEGGAIYTANSSNTWTNIYGGTFTGNTANDSGKEGSGAVFVQGSDLSSYGFRLSGAATFVGGVQADGTDGIYFSYTNSPMQITSALQSDVYVYLNSIDSWGTKTIAKGTDSYTLTETDAEHLKCYNGTLTDTTTWYTLLNTSKNCLNFSKTPPQQRHCICGSSTCTSTTGGHTGYSTYWTAWNETTSLPTTAGNYYLMKDVTLSDTWTVNANINLCLNGNTITGASGKTVIYQCGTLSITDCHSGTGVGKITHANGETGRGIHNRSVLNLWNGNITGNKLTGDSNELRGAGVWNYDGTVNMYGGSITNNQSQSRAGGVYNQKVWNMYGGEISGNSAEAFGGGVANDSNTAVFTMSGGSIKNNSATGTAADYTGGVFNYGGTLALSGNAVITGNTKNGAANNVRIYSGRLTSTGLGASANVGITGANGDIVVTGTSDKTGFTSDNDTLELVPVNNGLKLAQAHSHRVCGSTSCTHTDHTADLVWTAISDLSQITEAGNYYLTGNVELSATWECQYSDVNLCLNGMTITGADVSTHTNDVDVIKVNTGASLTITDCQTDVGKITHNGASGRGVNNTGTFTLWNGSITGNKMTTGGGILNNGTFYMNGGSITNNTGSSAGGGVYNTNTFTMTGGTISGNTGGNGGGVHNTGTFNVSGNAKISNNTKGSETNNVYLPSNSTITVAAAGMDSAASVGITVAYPNQSPTVVSGSTDTTVFTSDNTDYELVLDNNNGLKLSAIQVTISGVKLLDKAGGTEMTTKAYDGEAVAYSEGTYEPATVTGVTLTYTWQKKAADSTYTTLDAAPTDAGTYRLFVTATRGSTTLGTANYDFTITKANGVGTVTLDGWTYGGTANEPSPTSETNGTNGVTYEYKVKDAEYTTYTSEKPTNAGSYTIKATFPESDNYKEATATYNFTISPKALTVNVTVKEKTYDGKTDATVNATLDTTDVVGTDNVTLVTDGVTAANFNTKDVGTGKPVTLTGSYTLSGAAKDNYTLTQPSGITGSITPANLTITDLTVADKTYDGTNTATINSTPTLKGVVAGETVTLVNGTPTFSSVVVGNNIAINFTDFSISGDAAKNYTLKQPTGITANITAKELTVNVTAQNKTYDGKTDATVDATLDKSGVVGNDEVTLVTTGVTASFDNKDAGENKPVILTGSYTLSGAAKDNYTLAQPSGIAGSITPANLTITDLTVADKTYDGTNKATINSTPTLVGVVEGETVTLVNGTPTFSTVNVGENIAINFTDFTLEGTAKDNYTLTQPTGITANINSYTAHEGTEYTASTSDWTNQNFVVTATSGWKLSYTNTATGEWVDTLTCSSETGTDGETLTFYVKNENDGYISEAITKTYKIDKTPPTGEIRIDANHFWTEFLKTITFGLYYDNQQTVTITASDAASGIAKTEYLLTEEDLTVDKLADKTFTTYTAAFGINPDAKLIVYTRITDTAGNVTYLRSDGVVLDATPPVINGANNGRIYCAAVTLTITDNNLATVTVNGVTATLTDTGELTLNPATGAQIVVATDKAGNSTSITVTVNNGHTWGAWSSNGDGTHKRTCTVCNQIDSENCSGGTATCSAAAVCTTCSASYGAVNPSNHSALTHVPYKAATVYSTGNIEYWYCSGCGKYYLDANASSPIMQSFTVIPRLSGGWGVRTGDDSDLTLWLTLLLLSGAGIGAAIVLGKRKRYGK